MQDVLGCIGVLSLGNESMYDHALTLILLYSSCEMGTWNQYDNYVVYHSILLPIPLFVYIV